MKKIVALFLLITSLTLLPSCSGGVSRSQAKEYTESFVNCILAEDCDSALALMHPDCAVTAEEFQAIVNAFTAYGVDFSAVPEFQYTGFYSAMYDSKYGGSGYELSGYLVLDEIRVAMTSLVVSNDNGFGIYGINFDLPTDEPAEDGETDGDGIAAPLSY